MKAGSLPGAITVEDILYEQKQKLQLQTNYVRFETQKPAFCDYLLRRIPCYLRMRITQPLAYGRTNPNKLIISTGIYLLTITYDNIDICSWQRSVHLCVHNVLCVYFLCVNFYKCFNCITEEYKQVQKQTLLRGFLM